MGKSKSKQILDEIGNGMSESSREAIMSIDILEKRVAELEKALGKQAVSESEPVKPAPEPEQIPEQEDDE